MEDNRAVVKICKAGGPQQLMHLPQTHRMGAAAVAEQFARGIDLAHCFARDQAAYVGAERFERPPSWAEVIYLIRVAAPTFWTVPRQPRGRPRPETSGWTRPG
eukprot:2307925-Pyramimonas_sp.AAC.1